MQENDQQEKMIAQRGELRYNLYIEMKHREVMRVNIFISAKQIKKRGGAVAACPCELASVPDTLRQLIAMLVRDGVNAYNRRLRARSQQVLSQDDIDDMSRIGKIGFGIPFGTREANPENALETAIQGFEDGLYRVFIGEREISSLDEALALREGDTITMIRLVMLTGGFF